MDSKSSLNVTAFFERCLNNIPQECCDSEFSEFVESSMRVANFLPKFAPTAFPENAVGYKAPPYSDFRFSTLIDCPY